MRTAIIRSSRRLPPLALAAALWLPAVHAQAPTAPDEAPPDDATAAAARARVPLERIIEQVADGSSRSFVLDARAPVNVVAAGLDIAGIDYAGLLAVLASNGFAAVEIDGYVNIVPVGDIRQYPSPLVDARDRGIAEGEWVTTVIEIDSQELTAPMFVPVLRPMVSRAGHMAAIGDKLVIVEQFGNLRRIAEVIEMLQ